MENNHRVRLTTTLNLINRHKPCTDGYEKLINYLGSDFDADRKINLLTILDSNGVQDCLWAFRATHEPSAITARLIAADCAESVLYIFKDKYPDDNRPGNAIAVARNLRITKSSDVDAAYAAASAAVDAARTAADPAASAAVDAAAYAAYAAYAAAYAADAANAAAHAANHADHAACKDSFLDAHAHERLKQAQIIKKYLITDSEAA